MGLLWQRKASVTFGVKGEEGTKVEDLRIAFDIEKTRESNANTAKVTIYNLNENNRDLLKNKEDLFVILNVGYQGGDVDQLLIADITRSSTKRQGPDFITVIECEDGGQALTEAHIDKSYAPGTNLKSVISDVVNSFVEAGEVAVGTLSRVKDEIAQNGITVSGVSKVIMDDLIEKQDLEWSIQDNEVQVMEPLQDTGEEVVFLTPDTGLIGSPILREKGIEFKALIQSTKIRPGRPVNLESRQFEGLYRINKARYQGDTHDKTWYVLCEGIEV